MSEFRPASTALARVWQTRDRSCARPSVLVADDSALIRKLVAEVLEQAGYSVLHAADGAQVAERMHDHRVSVALLDLNMPGQEGLQAVRKLRSDHPEVKIVLMSADFVDVAPNQWEARGVEAVVGKASAERLLDTVRRLTAGRAGKIAPACGRSAAVSREDMAGKCGRRGGRRSEVAVS
jgi:CheY-like chemotaxis protein